NDGVEDFVNKNQDLESNNNNSSDSCVLPKSSVYSEFRTSLKDSTKSNLPFHINATKKNPTLGRKRALRLSQSNLQNVFNNEQEDKEKQLPTFTEPKYNIKLSNQSQSKKRNIYDNYNSYNKLYNSSVKEYNELLQLKIFV
ncbi:13478_t:CDS:2, partial [Gigaspora rosea]